MMCDYIKREDAINALKNAFNTVPMSYAIAEGILEDVPSADVIEVGKAYPREELEQYGLTEWKDKHGKRWVMVEKKDEIE